MTPNDLSSGGSDVDEDLLSKEALSDLFTNQYHLESSCSVGMKNSYILHLVLKDDSALAVALSNNSVVLYDQESLKKKVSFSAHDKTISGLAYSPINPNLIYTGSLDQSIKLWDLRKEPLKPVHVFMEKSSQSKHGGKALTSFDVNASDQFLAAGTEQVIHDSFLLFWDIRNPKLLGGYWNTFGDDVTSIKFHPTNPDMLATGGADSTVNIFDISQTCEDDALQTSTSVESGISSLLWFTAKGKETSLAIGSVDNQLSLWCIDDPGPKFHKTREDISLSLRRKVSDWTYIVRNHFDPDDEILYTMAGSSCPKNPCLRLLVVKKQKLKPFTNFSNQAIRSTIVRASAFDQVQKIFYSGSEEGYLCMWKPGAD